MTRELFSWNLTRDLTHNLFPHNLTHDLIQTHSIDRRFNIKTRLKFDTSFDTNTFCLKFDSRFDIQTVYLKFDTRLDTNLFCLKFDTRFYTNAFWHKIWRRGPRTLSKQLMQTLIVRLLKTHFFTPISLIVKSQQNRIELVTRPGAFSLYAW